ncbi:unnamed protein product [Rotaria sordida]|uniref:Polypeptide N-acetylgalactosaminyltransferase n=1 Tax=Rotaria sordida TaxID=392033 RepID=A0A818TPU5_9BILA|nr:unnamed protein product [Rotaria sordida]
MTSYIYRSTLYIFIVWCFVFFIFLQSNDFTRNSIDTQSSIKDEREEVNINSYGMNNFVRKLFKKSKNKQEQVIAPNIDDKKIDLNRSGEMGNKVEIDKNKLSPNELKKYEEGFEKHAFNTYISDLISYHRSLPDVREPDCQKIDYKSIFITASIVMCFHNEAWSVLLRSIHSIINRSPSHLLKEIILVDDFSDMDHLKKPLDKYIKHLKIVSIVRQKKREGLIRSRLAGAALVKGDVIIFLDSHIEVTEGWLEPLLDPISQNRTTVVTPIIETIDDKTFQYNSIPISVISTGGFDWNLQFNWHIISDREKQRRKHHLEPIRTPTMAGGLFAISKSYFYDLGTYDAGMDIWGGENLELSFRIWMCGGTLLISPCSHVGHIFRTRSPYKWLSDVDVIRKNTVRVAEVWLDEYKEYFYQRLNYNLGDYGDVTSRKLLRKKLQCKSFKWYLTEIYPELSMPEKGIAIGEIRNFDDDYCVDANTESANFNRSVISFPCHNQGGNQFFMLSKMGEIRRDHGCLDYQGGMEDVNKNDKVIVMKCDGQKGTQYWIYDENDLIYHPTSNLCMALSDDRTHIQMQVCNITYEAHKWLWERQSLNETNNT